MGIFYRLYLDHVPVKKIQKQLSELCRPVKNFKLVCPTACKVFLKKERA